MSTFRRLMEQASAQQMNAKDSLDGLIERVERCTGPDREIDGRIARIEGLSFGFCGDEGWWCGQCADRACGVPLGLHDERGAYPFDWRDDGRLPHYTASIGAALALVERLAPKLVIKSTRLGDGTGWWQVQEAWEGDTEVVDEWNPMDPRPAALAILQVLLALQSIKTTEPT